MNYRAPGLFKARNKRRRSSRQCPCEECMERRLADKLAAAAKPLRKHRVKGGRP